MLFFAFAGATGSSVPFFAFFALGGGGFFCFCELAAAAARFLGGLRWAGGACGWRERALRGPGRFELSRRRHAALTELAAWQGASYSLAAEAERQKGRKAWAKLS